MLRTFTILLAGLSLAACRSTSADGTDRSDAVSSAASGTAAEAEQQMCRDALGFDAGLGASSFDPGSRVLYRVRLYEGAQTRDWYVEMTIEKALTGEGSRQSWNYTVRDRKESIESSMLLARVALLELGWLAPHYSQARLPQRFLEQGLYEVCRLNQGRPASESARSLSMEEEQLEMAGWMSLIAFLQVIQENTDLSEVLWKVIKRPSMLSLLFEGGSIHLSLLPKFQAVELVPAGLPAPLDALEAYRLPIHIDVNGTRGLEVELLVCPSQPPLHLAAGMVRLEGTHPEHSDRRVVIELVGARGPAAQAGTGGRDR